MNRWPAPRPKFNTVVKGDRTVHISSHNEWYTDQALLSPYRYDVTTLAESLATIVDATPAMPLFEVAF